MKKQHTFFFYLFIILALVSIASIPTIPASTEAKEKPSCVSTTHIQENLKHWNQATYRIAQRWGDTKNTDIPTLFDILIPEYTFRGSKKMAVLPETVFQRAEAPSKLKPPTHFLTGSIKRSAKAGSLLLTLTSSQTNSSDSLYAYENDLSLANEMGSLNESVMIVVAQVAKVLETPLNIKKVLPYLYNSPSFLAMRSWARGFDLLRNQPMTAKNRTEARRLFEEAFSQDYNLVPAYLGLAETLAITALQEPETKGSLLRVIRVNWQKALLLQPELAKERGQRVKSYIQMLEKNQGPLCGIPN